jgi:hypothetical protein
MLVLLLVLMLPLMLLFVVMVVCALIMLQLDASRFSAVEWPRIREGIAMQTYEILLER